MFSPSTSTIASVSFSMISLLLLVVEDTFDELDVDKRHVCTLR